MLSMIRKGKIMKGSWKVVFISVFFGLSMALFVVLSHMRPLFDTTTDILARGMFLGILAVCFIFTSRFDSLKKTRPVFIALAIALIAMSADLYLPTSKTILNALKVEANSPFGIALDKLDSTVILVSILLILSHLAKDDLTSLSIRTGKKPDVTFGLIAFGVCVLGSFPMAGLFGAQDLSIERVLPWIPSILLFVFANAFNEELLFRALFLKKLSPIIGSVLSNGVLVIPFVLHHTGVDYSSDTLMLFAFLFPLAFVWGRLTQKTGNLWNAVLFHAGTDLPVILVLLSRIK